MLLQCAYNGQNVLKRCHKFLKVGTTATAVTKISIGGTVSVACKVEQVTNNGVSFYAWYFASVAVKVAPFPVVVEVPKEKNC